MGDEVVEDLPVPEDGIVWSSRWDKIAEQKNIFAEYFPKQVHFGVPHSQPLVEGIALASVIPPEITYKMRMEEKFYLSQGGQYPLLSNAQVEAVLYACQSFEQSFPDDKGLMVTQGFYLGDGTGVGKTRTLAAISYESMKSGFLKTVWMTASQKLFRDITGDILAFNDKIQVLTMSQLMKPEQIEKVNTRVLLVTYSIFTNQAEYSRLKNWMKKDFSGCLFFDESHYAKGGGNTSNPSLRGKCVMELQTKFPKARVVYSTATGASEVGHLIPMQRLQLWGRNTPFKQDNFKQKIVDKGVGALEVLAMEMKMRGVFVSRHISMLGLNFEIAEVKVSNQPGGNFFEIIYLRLTQLLNLVHRHLEVVEEAFMEKPYTFAEGETVIPRENEEEYELWLKKKKAERARKNRTYKGQHYSACLLLLGNLIMSSKVRTAANHVKKARMNGNCSIVGIQHTGWSMFMKYVDELEYYEGYPYSNIAYILRSILGQMGIRVGCPKTYVAGRDDYVRIGNWTDEHEAIADGIFHDLWQAEIPHGDPIQGRTQDVIPEESNRLTVWPPYSVGSFLEDDLLNDPANITWSFPEVQADVTPAGIARLYHELFVFLPINALDELVHRAEKDKIRVADMTGRDSCFTLERKVVEGENVEMWTQTPKEPSDKLRDAYQDGLKDLAIISTCSSVGISLHSDLTKPNQRKRIHITLEYGWGPENFLQQLGRSHRSNQRYLPEYVIIRSNVPAEERYSSVMSKRLKQMGTLTHGNSDASYKITDDIDDDLTTAPGAQCINAGIQVLMKDRRTEGLIDQLNIVEIRTHYKDKKASYFKKKIEDEVNHRLNRILMLPLEDQRVFFRTVRSAFDKIMMESEIHPALRDIDLSLKTFDVIMSTEKLVDGRKVILHGFRLDRRLSCDDLRRFRHDNPDWHFWKRGVGRAMQIALARQVTSSSGEERFHVMMPFFREKKIFTARCFRTWTQIDDRRGYEDWRLKVSDIERNPEKCVHERLYGSCERPVDVKTKCNFQWGIMDFFVIEKPTSWVISRLDETMLSFEVVRVIKPDGNITGLWLSKQNCSADNIQEWIEWNLTRSIMPVYVDHNDEEDALSDATDVVDPEEEMEVDD